MALADEGTIVYIGGSEYSPGSAAGEHRLFVHDDGRFELEHRRRGESRSWSGSLVDDVPGRLRGLLDAAGFPDVPEHRVPAGSAMRTVAIGDRSATMTWTAGAELPGWSEVFALLDGIAAAVDSGAHGSLVRSVD